MHPLFKGALFLTIASALSKLIGSLFRIPMQNIAGDELLGIFSIVYPIYMLTLTLSVAGIPIAVSKLISEKRMHDDGASITSLFFASRFLGLLFGVGCFLAIWLLSFPLASLLGGEQIRFPLIMVSATLLIAPYMAVYRGYFQGFEMMHQTAISQIIEQVFRVGIMLCIVYFLVELDFSYPQIAGWMMIGSIAGAGISLLYLFSAYRRQTKSLSAFVWKTKNWAQFKQDSTSLLTIAIPIAFGSISFSLMPVVDSLTIPYGLQQFGVSAEKVPHAFGIYSRGIIFVQMITMLASSVVTPLIPHLARLRQTGEWKKIQQTAAKTIWIVQLTSWPVVMISVLFITPLNITLFTDTNGNAVIVILLISGGFLSLALLSTAILQALAYEKQAAVFVCIAIGIKVIGNLAFLPAYGLMAAAYVTLFSYGLLVLLNVSLLKRLLSISIFPRKLIAVLFGCFCLGFILRIPMMLWGVGVDSRGEAFLYSLTVGFIFLIIAVAVWFLWWRKQKKAV
ncbi:polysaccharide biosynthesis protein [Oceanobacillus sp. J11TS1]|uniref:putative polysaccharide biosynthesis protein n=1 Tax=Oceanobacillus sp. J11TS1 TaxID=2807191 RepID=UPI001B2179CA|nr:polysaccharide biosynthesis protein [Oceanobacillus sp. J11TS1]GIO23400.1 polysaccharide biosynthesis protein [Oceanobacillus sp. J11TS1]